MDDRDRRRIERRILRKERKFERKERRDFWRDWKDEQKRRWHGQTGLGLEADFFSTAEMLQVWREFFHAFMGDWPEGHWIFGGRRFSPWHQGMASFNPFVANVLSKGGGLLPLYVLHLVADKPRYGNEIMEIIANRTGGQWVSNPGAIYPLLTELEQQHLIEGSWEDPQKRTIRIYRVTDTGKEELSRLKAFVVPKLDEAIAVLKKLTQDMGGDTAPEDEEPDAGDMDYGDGESKPDGQEI
ncbi:MAG TPA: PadR family transcriptional regulator [Aggregatilineales bacterium]|nr:PadR family transcriptional regulator [Aggregatilineales bacterium]